MEKQFFTHTFIDPIHGTENEKCYVESGNVFLELTSLIKVFLTYL